MKRPAHILHLMTAIDRGGAENHLVDLIRHQRDSGVAVTVGYFRGRGYWAGPLREMGATVHDLGLRFYGDLRPLRALRRLIREEPFDLVHAHLPPAELYARLALLGIPASELPLIISKHNDCAFHRIPGERLLGRWVARRATTVIAISEAVRRFMIGPELGLPPRQVETIYYGIDALPFELADHAPAQALRHEWGVTDDTLVIGFAGRLVEQKSIDTLIRAFAIFRERSSRDARLVIAGRGPLEAELRQQAAAAGVADHVVWAGFHEDVPRLMNAFDVFAITSVHEGFGLVLVEAMAAGKPVVATRAGAIPEVVLDGATGALAASHDPEAIAAALERCAAPETRAAFGAAGRQRVRDTFTLSAMWRQTDELYARCLPPTTRPAHEAAVFSP